MTTPADHARHAASGCTSNPLRSGPDLRAIMPDQGEMIYDHTTVHEMSSSYLTTPIHKLVDGKIKEKVVKYVDSGMIAPHAFVVLPVFSLGGIHPNTVSFLRTMARLCHREVADVIGEFSARLQIANGETVAMAAREFVRRRGPTSSASGSSSFFTAKSMALPLCHPLSSVPTTPMIQAPADAAAQKPRI